MKLLNGNSCIARHVYRLLVAGAMTFATCSSALALVLEEVPLFLLSGVKPNLLIAIDDSGSMDSEVIMVTSSATTGSPTNDGALWWRVGSSSTGSFTGRDADDASVPGVVNYNKLGAANATWRKYVNLFPNGHNDSYNGKRLYSNAQEHYAVPPTNENAYVRSPEYNKAYYNPDVEYKPWAKADGTSYPDAAPTAAYYDPDKTTPAGAGTINLTATVSYAGTDQNFMFYFYPGMKDTNNTTTITTASAKPMAYLPATYYRPAGTADNTGYSATPDTTGTNPAGASMARYEIISANYSSTAAYNKAIQNFANWFTYYRKRHLAARGGVGLALKDIKGIRADTFTINGIVGTPTPQVSMLDLNVTADKSALYTKIYKSVGKGGTPNRGAIDYAGKQYMRINNGAPITAECQQNYTALLTDGFSTLQNMNVGNQDLGAGAPYEDAFINTIADIAMKYYKTPLRTDFPAGKVIPNQFDDNKNLHMVTFGIGLGIKGRIFGNTHHNTADAKNPIPGAPTWADPAVDRDPVQVDDLYHATINSRGELFKADSPQAVASAMSLVFGNVQERPSASAAVGINAGVLTTGSKVYQALFHSGLWYGQLHAFGQSTTAVVATTPDWKAETLLAARTPASRQILTRGATGGVAFRWANISTTQKNYLHIDPITNVADTHGEKRLDYLRGDTSRENATTSPLFRKRSGNALGDIIHSSPVFVGKPSQQYPLDAVYPDSVEGISFKHSDFVSTNIARPGVIYVGANDGMLHAFNAADGQELFAYVPSNLFPKLNKLTNINYLHTYFVDLTPSVGDAFFNGAWHTMLVGGLGGGGKGYFALDITDPSTITEGTASTAVKWEFTDNNDPDLGHTFSEVSIAKLNSTGGSNNTGDWAAIFGNGYNSATGVAALYIVNIETGALIKKISVGGTPGDPNGLSTPTLLDTDGDHKVDFVYAGDLKGNLWKFDLQGPSGTWGIKYSPNPLFRAVDASNVAQPITQKPFVSPHPDGQAGYMVYFGTGKYLEMTDNTVAGAQQQSFYGIWDKNASTLLSFTRANLLSQTLTTDIAAKTRKITSDPINWNTHSGWYVNLDAGEKSVTDPTVRATAVLQPRVIFTTLIPSTLPCDFGGSGYLMELSPINGGAFSGTIDLDNDGIVDTNEIGVVGVDAGIGIPSKVSIVTGTDGIIYKQFMGSKEGKMAVYRNMPPAPPVPGGRRSWRQLR